MRTKVLSSWLGLFGLTSVLAATSVRAADLYVSTQGNDSNPGTSSQPFRTITQAYASAVAGTTIHVLPGVYTDYSSGWGLHLGASGSASSPIVLRSEPRGGAVIDGQNASDRNQGIYVDGSYNVVDGFEIRNGPKGGITVSGNYNQILNSIVHNNGNLGSSPYGQDGIYSDEGCTGTIYKGNYIHHNGRTGSNLDHGLYLCGDSEQIINNIVLVNAACGLQIAGYATVSSMKVYNNVFAFNGTDGIILWMALSGVDIKNNILYQNGHWAIGTYAATGSGVNVDHNLCFGNVYGNYSFTDGGSTCSYALGTTVNTDPLFANGAASTFDAHLNSGSPAIQAGLNLSSVFTTDLAGAARSASGAWDLGTYVSSSAANQPPTISSIANQTVLAGASVGPLSFQVSDPQTAAGSLTVSATSSNPTLVPVANIVLGGSGSSRTVTVTPNAAQTGTSTFTLKVSDGTLSASTSFTLTVNASPSTTPPSTTTGGSSSSLSFASSSGTLTAPFSASNGMISQPSYTSLSGSGRAAYTFTVPGGNYVVSALINAPSTDGNSLFVNIDAEPTDPLMIWDVPVTTGTASCTVSWRGYGTASSTNLSGMTAQFAPKVFTLSAGTHQLIVRGREPNCQLGTITIVPLATSYSASFASTSGTLAAPFVAANGMISQPAYTPLSSSGRAAYSFTVPSTADYVVSALVNAPTSDANSFWVNIDTEPTDPLMVWDVPLTTGAVSQTVSWRGNGTANSTSLSGMAAQFSPKRFNLTAGTHQLIVRGREPGCQLGTFTVASAGVMDMPWQALDVGSVSLAGSSSVAVGVCGLSGSGSIGGTADAFRYVYQSMSGDGEIRAQLSSVQSGSASGCVGVMIRETLTTGSRFALMGLSGAGTCRWVTRSSTSSSSVAKAGQSATAPNCWVRVVRTGNTLCGYSSPNGNIWILVGSTTISMAANIQLGFAVASGTASSATSASLSNLFVIP